MGRCGGQGDHSAQIAFSDSSLRVDSHLGNTTGTLGESQFVFKVCLEVKLEVKISIVEGVNSNVSVLSSTSVATAVRVELQGVDGAEMS